MPTPLFLPWSQLVQISWHSCDLTVGTCHCVYPTLQVIRLIDLSQNPPTISLVLGALPQKVTAGYVEQVGTAARLSSPVGLFANSTSLLFVDFSNDRVRVAPLGSDGMQTTTSRPLVGRGNSLRDGVLAKATLADPQGIAIATNGDIFVSGKARQCAHQQLSVVMHASLIAGECTSGFFVAQTFLPRLCRVWHSKMRY
jgi:hypothetical protein